MRNVLYVLMIALFMFSCGNTSEKKDACGDGLIDPGELCDGAELGGASCVSLGYNGGALSCAADCTLELGACESAGRCGDGVIQGDYEDCDGASLNGHSCQSQGFAGGVLACGADCRFDSSQCQGVCGNSLVEPDEACDDGGLTDGDGCSASCEVEEGWVCSDVPSQCVADCGDGWILLGQETCDGAELDGQSCELAGYYGGTLACSPQCQLDWSSCEAAGRCGDLVVQAPQEACDGPEAGVTCLSLGYFGGDLACDGCVRTGCLGLSAMDGGYLFSCALDHLGNAWCWGADYAGQLGNGADPESTHPVPVTMPAGVRFERLAAAKNAHVCALDHLGNAWCWGLNGSGQLGDNSTTSRLEPVAVQMPASTSFLRIAGGYNHTCALDATGNTWCWGAGANGQLGRGSTAASPVPVAVTMPPGVTFSAISAGDYHTCALTATGVAYCWGLNDQGQLGDGTTTQRLSPTLVVLPQNVRFSTLDAASYSTMALDLVGNLYTWGGYALARTTGSQTQPVIAQMPVGVSFASVQGGEFHACALDTTGAAWCWGDCNTGECGATDFTDLIRPVAMPNGTVFTGMGLGAHAGCGFDILGALWCWGVNSNGQLGDNTNVNRATPTRTFWP
jgi:cysteine-rich repeat protein